jgi:hypothetical protein
MAAIYFAQLHRFVETFGAADEVACRVAHGDDSQAHRDDVAIFVAKGDMPFRGLAVAQHRFEGLRCRRKLGAGAIGIAEKILAASMAYHVLPEVAGNTLRAAIPEQDFAVATDKLDAGGQVLKDAAIDFKVLE